MRVLFAFSNNLMSEGISGILAGEKDIHVNISHPSDLIHELRENIPDILLVDLFVMNNFLSGLPSQTKVLLLDTGCEKQNIDSAFITNKISGVIEMDTNKNLFMKAIIKVMKGHLWISKKRMKQLVEKMSDLSRLADLTTKERDILYMVAKGMDTKLIAKVLGKKQRTVTINIHRIQKKCRVSDSLELVNVSRQFNSFEVSDY